MKKHILLIATSIVILSNSYAQYDPTIWQVEDSTVNVQSITGLSPSNGFNSNGEGIIPGYGETYTYSWLNDVCKVNFTNTTSPNQWSDFTFSLLDWEGETGNYFTKNPSGVLQQHNIVKGYTVDFSQPENRIVTFKVQTTNDITFWGSLRDISGKISNGVFPSITAIATLGGINVTDETKWQTITFSWGGSATADSAVTFMEDWYSGSWWGIDNTGRKDAENPLDSTKIAAFNLMFDAGSIGFLDDYKEVYIKDVVIGAATNPQVYHPQRPFYIINNLIIIDELNTAQVVDIVSDTNWTAVSDQSWLAISPNSGNGNGQLTVVATENAGNIRYATITVTSIDGKVITIPVTQVSINPELTISNQTLQLGALVTLTASTAVTSNTTWNVTTDETWLYVNPSTGIGNGTITFRATQNNSNTDRTAIVLITYPNGGIDTIFVTQLSIFSTYSNIWQVEDQTINVKTITGLVPSNGFDNNGESIIAGYDNTYSYSWENDICRINFTKQFSQNWSDFSFKLIDWEGESNNIFMTTVDGVPQDHKTIQGYTVDFTEPSNRLVSFKIQASEEVILWTSLTDVRGKVSNGAFPEVVAQTTIGGVDVDDESKWQTITVSWGGDLLADSAVTIMEDWYSSSWWGVNNEGLKLEHTPIDSSKIAIFNIMFDPFETGIIGREKIIYIKDIQIGVDSLVEYRNYATSRIIEVSPGNLSSLITQELRDSIQELTLTGSIDVRDFIFIRDSLPNIQSINMNDVTIVGFEGEIDSALIKAFVTFPANTIPSAAFKNKDKLHSIILPQTLEVIQDYAFSGCTELQDITITSLTVVSIENGASVFDGIDRSVCRINVPLGTESLYANADGWKDFENIEEALEIKDITIAKKIVVSPNPVVDNFSINGLQGIASIEVLDVTGKIIVSKTIVDAEQIQFSNVPKGVYIVKVITDSSTAQMKLVKK